VLHVHALEVDGPDLSACDDGPALYRSDIGGQSVVIRQSLGCEPADTRSEITTGFP
jgi:hypothetical protein